MLTIHAYHKHVVYMSAVSMIADGIYNLDALYNM
jgi:hypothetical protein